MINHKFVSYTFSPFFSSPNPNFGVLLEKWEYTNVFRIETLFPSAFIFLFSRADKLIDCARFDKINKIGTEVRVV